LYDLLEGAQKESLKVRIRLVLILNGTCSSGSVFFGLGLNRSEEEKCSGCCRKLIGVARINASFCYY
jgi:hypothetical protein